MSSYHNQTYARFLCRASAFAHLIKLSTFLASGWIKELFGRQGLIDLHHAWRQHSRCFDWRPALVLWRRMRTYQELCCSCQVWTDGWRLWREMHGDEFVEPLRNNSKLSPLIDPRSSDVMTHFLKCDFCGEISHQINPHFNCSFMKFLKQLQVESDARKILKIAFSECQMDVDRREVGPTGNNRVKLTNRKTSLVPIVADIIWSCLIRRSTNVLF